MHKGDRLGERPSQTPGGNDDFRWVEKHVDVISASARLGPQLLAEISGVTGASAYVLDNPNNLPRIAGDIAVELRNRYILGYSPSNSRHDGKWRKIKVRLGFHAAILNSTSKQEPATTVVHGKCIAG